VDRLSGPGLQALGVISSGYAEKVKEDMDRGK